MRNKKPAPATIAPSQEAPLTVIRVCGVCSLRLGLAEPGFNIGESFIHEHCRSRVIKNGMSLTGGELKKILNGSCKDERVHLAAAALQNKAVWFSSPFIRGSFVPDNGKQAPCVCKKTVAAVCNLASILDQNLVDFHASRRGSLESGEREILRKVKHLVISLRNNWVEIEGLPTSLRTL